MSLISLKNVSKFYYSKGIIASGFSKLNLDLSIGEFVAITGESGSGKSTLLNVISGLDSYEEGEMYINGEETSHYTEKDFEDYRRKYIGNIFQNFNLINSYTVYQNIELVLLLNGYKKKNIKKEVIELIKKVDLYKFRNTKVSKLSGGQKQRVAIARSLAKDTPIIIADEPTGNLDSKSAKGIIKLLSEIAKNKLVVIVTHNYEQVEEHVTRKIKMHDGKIVEDKEIKNNEYNNKVEELKYRNITFLNKIRLGIRNTFNIKVKFVLVLLVYLFVVSAITFEYASFKQEEYILNKSGYNYIFHDLDDKRIILKKEDKTVFNENDYNLLENTNNVDQVIKNDLLLDNQVSISDDNEYWIYGGLDSINNFNGDLDLGTMPTNDFEIILYVSKNDYYLGYRGNDLIGKELYLTNVYTGQIEKDTKMKVVGIKYDNSNYQTIKMYVSDLIINKFSFSVNQEYSTTKVLFENIYHESNPYNPEFKIVSSDKVKDGEAFISYDYNYYCKNNSCRNHIFSINVSNMYYKQNLDLKITNFYRKTNFKKLLNLDNYEIYIGNIFISVNDYNNLYNKGNYQASIKISDINKMDETVKYLNKQGFNTFKVKDTIVTEGSVEILKIFKTIVTIILVVILFFISYFVIKIILKSRNIYFSTIRMLGSTKKVCKQLLSIELLNIANIAYLLFIFLVILSQKNIIHIGLFKVVNNYTSITDFIIIYFVLAIMSYVISLKFAKKVFKNSAIESLREEN